METTQENTKWYQSFTIKMIGLAIISLLLLIPLEMVKSVIRERINYSNDAKREITRMWSDRQTVAGPVLNIPISKTDVDGKQPTVDKTIHIMPEDLEIDGTVLPEIRYKSLYKSVVYGSNIILKGSIKIPKPDRFSDYLIHWESAYITVGISDNRGIRGSVTMDVNGKVIHAVPGVEDTDLYKSGVTFKMPLTGDEDTLDFAFSLSLNGSENITFNPIGKRTEVVLTSSWADPSFTGDFLPYDRRITTDGFTAKWQITELNRSFPQFWLNRDFKFSDQQFGVDFLLMADHYQKSLRSVKYGILFILLTFITLIFAEVIFSTKIQIFHYVLVAFALILFFSLLTALSEQIGFNYAYTVAMIAIVGLIAFFSKGFMENTKMVIILNGLLILFYVFIFVLLSLKDYAYLAGNIGLLVILSTIMGISRKLNLNKAPREEAPKGT